MEKPIQLPKEIMQYLPLLPVSVVVLFALILPIVLDGSVFSVDAMSSLPDSRFGALFFAIAIFDFLFVAFIADKAFRGGGQGNAQFAPAAYAMCELPAILGFIAAFINKTPAFFAPFALLTVLYSLYLFSKSRAQS